MKSPPPPPPVFVRTNSFDTKPFDAKPFDADEKKNTGTNVTTWNHAVESKLADLCDHAKSFAWMHDRSYRTMRRRSFVFAIPVIVINILTSSASFGLTQYVTESDQKWLNVGVGSMNILAAILTAVDKLYGYSERVGMHKSALNAWTKLSTALECELSLPRDQRTPSDIFWKHARGEFDRLLEISPIIPHHILKAFRRIFSKQELSAPVVVGALRHTLIYSSTNENKPPPPPPLALQIPSIETEEADLTNQGSNPTTKQVNEKIMRDLDIARHQSQVQPIDIEVF